MQIIKRNGATESYDREKIAVAIRKSFASTQKEITDEAVYTIVDEVELFLHQNEANRSVERIHLSRGRCQSIFSFCVRFSNVLS